MGGRKRILTVFGTRPEAIKLFPLLHALAEDVRFESRACVTGQHRKMLDQVLALAEVKPDYDLSLMRPGQSLDQLTAALLAGLGPVMDEERPDWVVVHCAQRGDIWLRQPLPFLRRNFPDDGW